MLPAVVLRLGLFVVGLVLGALVVFLVMYFTQESSEGDCTDVYDENFGYTGSRVADTLQMVVMVSRHGNRGGSSDYALDPYPLSNATYWPYGASALTPVGRVQAYKLGRTLRSFYNGFLNITFKTADVYGNSDLVERVVMSGDLVLAGLYPPVGWQVWNSSVYWQPIALYTNSLDRSEDVFSSCSRFVEEEEESYSAFLADNEANTTALCNVLKNATGVNATASTLSSTYDKVISEDTEGYVLPSWLDEIYPQPYTEYFGNLFKAMYAGTDTMVRLLIGEMYSEIVEHMQSKSNGSLSPDRKIYIYSAHDTSVLAMQVAVGVEPVIKPVKVASALILELHKNSTTSDYFVKALYVNGSSLDSDPIALTLPDCGDPCYLDSLVNSTQRFLNVSFTEECATTSTSSSSTTTSTTSSTTLA